MAERALVFENLMILCAFDDGYASLQNSVPKIKEFNVTYLTQTPRKDLT